MKKFSIAFFAAVLFFASCENSGSSTIGTYDKEETHSTESKEEGGSGSESNEKGISADTARTGVVMEHDSTTIEH